jgi:beta-glucanase (GH16 family)
MFGKKLILCIRRFILIHVNTSSTSLYLLYYNRPLCGEIDFFEMQTLWDYTPSTLHFKEHNSGNSLSYFSYETFKTVNEWHVFGVEWSNTHIAFYHDGKRIGEYPVPNDGVTQVNWPFDYQNPFYLIINNAMNPEWGTKAADDLLEHDMEVDWIAVEKKID